ncbi:hypothetical protein V8C86DRAFT_2721554 [Haematococcus lacustris]
MDWRGGAGGMGWLAGGPELCPGELGQPLSIFIPWPLLTAAVAAALGGVWAESRLPGVRRVGGQPGSWSVCTEEGRRWSGG